MCQKPFLLHVEILLKLIVFGMCHLSIEHTNLEASVPFTTDVSESLSCCGMSAGGTITSACVVSIS